LKLSIKAGSTSQTVNVFVRDSSSITGGGLTGLVFNSAGLTAYYALPRAAAVSITLATLAAVTSGYSSGGFKEIDAANMAGWYRLDIPDAALASGRFVSFHLKGASNMAPLPLEIELTGWDNQDSVRGGMSALPNAAPGANGGLPTTDGTKLNQTVDATAAAIAAIVDAVWDELLSGHVGAGSAGEALDAAGTAGDPWITALPGSYSAGQAGFILGTNADTAGTTTLLSRLTSGRAGNLDNLDAAISAVLTAIDAVPTGNENADALLDRAAGVETNRTPRQAFRLILAALAGKLSGAATTTVTIRDTNDTVDRVVATVDSNGNRSAVTLNAS
jgi:hypothetical protein